MGFRWQRTNATSAAAGRYSGPSESGWGCPAASSGRAPIQARRLPPTRSTPNSSGIWARASAAVGARAVGRNLGLRRLLTTAQPVRALRAVEYADEVFVHLPNQRPGRITAATVPVLVDNLPEEWSHQDEDDEDRQDEDEKADEQDEQDEDWQDEEERWYEEPVAALVYGDPRPGHWCAVEIDGRLRLPSDAVSELDDLPVDPTTGGYAPMAEEPPVDPALLTEVDRLAGPGDVRTHRPHPLSGWARTVAGPVPKYFLTGALLTGFFSPTSLALSLGVASSTTAVCLLSGWRS